MLFCPDFEFRFVLSFLLVFTTPSTRAGGRGGFSLQYITIGVFFFFWCCPSPFLVCVFLGYILLIFLSAGSSYIVSPQKKNRKKNFFREKERKKTEKKSDISARMSWAVHNFRRRKISFRAVINSMARSSTDQIFKSCRFLPLNIFFQLRLLLFLFFFFS